MAPFSCEYLICYLSLIRRVRLGADRFVGMFQMVANCELRRKGTQTSDGVALCQRTPEDPLQKTLKSDVMFTGVGLHCGRDVSLRVRPAAAQTGIWFRRTDISDADPFISANWQFAVHTALCTRLANADGLGVSTVEHVMAAIAGCGINNAVVELDGPEVPIMDGSALEFVRGFLKAGLIEQAAPVEVLEILQTVEVEENGAYAALVPFSGIEMDFSIDFPDKAIGQQSKTLNLANGSFVHELCDSRTFCRNSDVQMMRSKGLALGGTLMNAVVIEGADVLSPGGCATRMNLCAIKCWMLWVILRLLVARLLVAMLGGARVTPSPTNYCASFFLNLARFAGWRVTRRRRGVCQAQDWFKKTCIFTHSSTLADKKLNSFVLPQIFLC